MPIYEYVCSGCRNEFEVLVRGDEQVQCPACSGDRLEKQFSVTASPHQQNGAASASSLPVANPESCGAPRCCGGGCQF